MDLHSRTVLFLDSVYRKWNPGSSSTYDGPSTSLTINLGFPGAPSVIVFGFPEGSSYSLPPFTITFDLLGEKFVIQIVLTMDTIVVFIFYTDY